MVLQWICKDSELGAHTLLQAQNAPNRAPILHGLISPLKESFKGQYQSTIGSTLDVAALDTPQLLAAPGAILRGPWQEGGDARRPS